MTVNEAWEIVQGLRAPWTTYNKTVEAKRIIGKLVERASQENKTSLIDAKTEAVSDVPILDRSALRALLAGMAMQAIRPTNEETYECYAIKLMLQADALLKVLEENK